MVTNAVKKRKFFEKVVLDTSINPFIEGTSEFQLIH